MIRYLWFNENLEKKIDNNIRTKLNIIFKIKLFYYVTSREDREP